MLYFTAAVLIIWNVITFAMMGVDKLKAKTGAWRIPEKVLLTSAFLLGAPGSIAGALVFRHKIRKLKFIVGLPAALIFNVAVMIYGINILAV